MKLDRRRNVELALKFPLVLNRLVVAKGPACSSATYQNQPAGVKWNRTSITIPG